MSDRLYFKAIPRIDYTGLNIAAHLQRDGLLTLGDAKLLIARLFGVTFNQVQFFAGIDVLRHNLIWFAYNKLKIRDFWLSDDYLPIVAQIADYLGISCEVRLHKFSIETSGRYNLNQFRTEFEKCLKPVLLMVSQINPTNSTANSLKHLTALQQLPDCHLALDISSAVGYFNIDFSEIKPDFVLCDASESAGIAATSLLISQFALSRYTPGVCNPQLALIWAVQLESKMPFDANREKYITDLKYYFVQELSKLPAVQLLQNQDVYYQVNVRIAYNNAAFPNILGDVLDSFGVVVDCIENQLSEANQLRFTLRPHIQNADIDRVLHVLNQLIK